MPPRVIHWQFPNLFSLKTPAGLHRIEYLLPAFEGDELEVRTWIADMKRVRAQRKYDFTRKSDGKVIANGETHWVYVDLTTGRPIPIPDEMVILFPITTG